MNYGLIIIALLLTSCAQRPSRNMKVVVAPVAETTLSSNEVDSLRSGEIVKKYYVGAYVDPAHPQVRHDPHVVERIEQCSRWNLRPNVPVVVSGPTYKAVEDNALKNAMQLQYDSEIKKERRANSEAQTQAAQLKQEINDLKVKMLAQSESTFKHVEEKIESLNEKINTLEHPPSQSQAGIVPQQSHPQTSMNTSQQSNKPWESQLQGE